MSVFVLFATMRNWGAIRELQDELSRRVCIILKLAKEFVRVTLPDNSHSFSGSYFAVELESADPKVSIKEMTCPAYKF